MHTAIRQQMASIRITPPSTPFQKIDQKGLRVVV